ncbi:MAG: pyridoxamine 5'-phosphate oxidase family protein, partial [Lachnospiraceae bacterium]|nr:pyridoxamine 5'-phosphate oxidase family protein [Lachnospiraceae bacterium]
VNSVIVFGKIQLVEDREKVLKSAMELAMHIFPEQKEFYKDDLERNKGRVQILEITPEHITGKKVHEQ